MAHEENSEHKRLSDLGPSEQGVIVKVFGHGSFRKRITEMGFVRGKCVKVIKNAPLLDPIEYEIMGYRVALRRSEAELIEVSVAEDVINTSLCATGEHRTFGGDSPNRLRHAKINTINVALVGNPNCGKTSLFNSATGAHEKVGNYSGVTVDVKQAVIQHDGYTITMSDLPGTYSITEYTPEELYVRTHILQNMPDVVINVVDSSNLERNLYLTTQLIDMNIKVIIALNMYDELEKSGIKFDYKALGRMLGIPIIPTVASKGEGIKELLDKVIDVFEDNEKIVRHIHINYGTDIEKSILEIQNLIWKDADIVARYSSRYISIKLLEDDKSTLSIINKSPFFKEITEKAATERAKLEKYYNDTAETVISDAKYGFIAGALSETMVKPNDNKVKKTRDIDRIMTHRIWGIPIFLFLMWLMFQATFTIGEYPMGWIENGIEYLADFVNRIMNEGPLKDLIIDGVISGVGGVLVFLPNILILFMFISIMEDTGYMARASFIMDKLMHKIGLHGKSFIPLLMGFGCNVPAVMATRTLESRKDRIITMLIIPFMSCSARLPIYILLISAFFDSYHGLVLFSIYLIGIIVAVISSLIFQKTIFSKEEAPFVMELPPYRVPTARSIVRHMWNKGAQYLKKMGQVILLASIIIWALGYYPRHENLSPAQQQEQSYIGKIGKTIEPILAPLGFDWKIGVSLVTGIAAKEIVVSSMTVLNQADEDTFSLEDTLRQQNYTPLTAYGFMIFALLYIPCIAVFAAIRKEAGIRWALFSALYSTVIAWILAFLIHSLGTFWGKDLQTLSVGIILAIAAIYIIIRIVRVIRKKQEGRINFCESCMHSDRCQDFLKRNKHNNRHTVSHNRNQRNECCH